MKQRIQIILELKINASSLHKIGLDGIGMALLYVAFQIQLSVFSVDADEGGFDSDRCVDGEGVV